MFLFYDCSDSKGRERFVVPKQAGYIVNAKRKYILIESHYDNPELTEGVVDQSGMRLYYTDTPRKHEAATLLLGDGFIASRGATIDNLFEYEYSCPSSCTRKFPNRIKMFSSFMHTCTRPGKRSTRTGSPRTGPSSPA